MLSCLGTGSVGIDIHCSGNGVPNIIATVKERYNESGVQWLDVEGWYKSRYRGVLQALVRIWRGQKPRDADSLVEIILRTCCMRREVYLLRKIGCGLPKWD